MLEMKIKIEADAAVLKAIDKLTTALEKNAVNISVPQDTPTPVAPVAAPVTHAPGAAGHHAARYCGPYPAHPCACGNPYPCTGSCGTCPDCGPY